MAGSEVEQLQARIAELESRLAHATGAEEAPQQRRRSPWLGVASAVVLTLACILAPLSVASVWASAVLSDTDRYVETVAPLAQDPAVQQAVADDVTRAALEALDAEQVTQQALEVLAQQENVPPRVAAALPGLAVPITNGIESFTRDQVETLLATPQFARLWAQVNQVAHTQVVRLLEGDQSGAVTAQGDTITLNLAPVIEAVKNRLVDRGFTLAENIPTVDRQFVLVQSDAITSAQSFYRLLTTLGIWLPIVTLVLFVAGVLLARDRRRAVVKGALGVTGSMLVLGVVLALARMWYVGTTPAGILTEQAAGDVFDTMVRFLRTGLRSVAVLGLVVALGAFLAGPSRVAVKTRATVEGSIGSARHGAENRGWDTGRTGAWIFAHRAGLRVTVLVAAGLVLVFWSRPSAWVVLGVALVAVLLLALLEFLATPPQPTVEPPPQPAPATDDTGPTQEPTLQSAQKGPDPHA